jgi:hypothetical protein
MCKKGDVDGGLFFIILSIFNFWSILSKLNSILKGKKNK